MEMQKISLDDVNSRLKTIDVKGKKYVMVNERVRGFRMMYPGGQIVTEIVQMDDERVTIKATVLIDGKTIATGLASEEKAASYINKTSYIENCETSAVGRALGFAGIGIDDSMGSADEIANAILQQEAGKKPIDALKYNALVDRCNADGVDMAKLCAHYKVKSLKNLSEAQHSHLNLNWADAVKACRLQAN